MSASSWIDSLISLTTRVAYMGLPPPDAGKPEHDSRQGAWQRELARAQGAARVQQASDGRSALASLSVAFDPLLLKTTPIGRMPSATWPHGTAARQADTTRHAATAAPERGDARAHRDNPSHGHDDEGRVSPPTASGHLHEIPLDEGTSLSESPAASAADACTDATAASIIAHPLSSEPAAAASPSEAPQTPAQPTAAPALRIAMHGFDTAEMGEALADPAATENAADATLADAATSSARRMEDAIANAMQPHAPIRLHVQWSAAGARVWIGLDADSAGDAAQVVASVARCLGRVGARLQSVVCNGIDMSLRDADIDAGTATAHPFPIDLLVERTPSWPPSAP